MAGGGRKATAGLAAGQLTGQNGKESTSSSKCAITHTHFNQPRSSHVWSGQVVLAGSSGGGGGSSVCVVGVVEEEVATESRS